MDLTQVPECQHFLGNWFSSEQISSNLQNVLVVLSRRIALPGGKGQKEYVPVQGRKVLPHPRGSISPWDAGHQWGAGLPCLNWSSHASSLYLCSDEGFPLERDMSTHRKPVCYLYHTVQLANMVQKGIAGADNEMSFVPCYNIYLSFLTDTCLQDLWVLTKNTPPPAPLFFNSCFKRKHSIVLIISAEVKILSNIGQSYKKIKKITKNIFIRNTFLEKIFSCLSDRKVGITKAKPGNSCLSFCYYRQKPDSGISEIWTSVGGPWWLLNTTCFKSRSITLLD